MQLLSTLLPYSLTNFFPTLLHYVFACALRVVITGVKKNNSSFIVQRSVE